MANTAHFTDQALAGQQRPQPPTSEMTLVPDARPLAPEGDRKKAFRRARAHTIVVKLLRLALPIAAVCAAGFYALAAIKTTGWGKIAAQLPVPKITAENLTMENPVYNGFTKDGGAYKIAAASAQQDFSDTTFIKLETIKGELVDAKKSKTVLVATRGTLNTKTNVLTMRDGIDIRSQDGMHAILKTATVQTKAGTVTTKDPVQVTMAAGRINADTMFLNQKKRVVAFEKNVIARLTPKTNAKKQPTKRSNSATPAPLIGGSDAPIDITADRLDVDDANYKAVFQGQVKAFQDGATLVTKQLDIDYESNDAAKTEASGTSSNAAGPASGQAAKVRRIVARYPILMTQGPDSQVTSQSADFDAINETALLLGKVVMVMGDDRRAVSDRAELDARADTALLVGNVVVKQGTNELRGQRLFVDRQAGTTRLTTPGRSNNKPGRIAARFAAPNSKPGTKAASAKPRNAGVGGAFAFKTTPGAPVEVDADSLTVDDNIKKAIFRGDVQARQGAFLIRTIRLTAIYTGSAQLGDPGAKTTKKAGDATNLTRVLAKGKVVVTSENGQKASGDWADFNIKENTLLLGGDVVLTKGKNIIRGSRLSIDMTTGRSVIDVNPDSVGGWESSLRDRAGNSRKIDAPENLRVRGRPSAVFYPAQMTDGDKKTKSRTKATAPNSQRRKQNSSTGSSSWAPVGGQQ